MGQAPPPQQPPPKAGPAAHESHAGVDALLLCPTEKPDSNFLMSVPPHFSHVCFVASRLA
jgi:hypothetical protein